MPPEKSKEKGEKPNGKIFSTAVCEYEPANRKSAAYLIVRK